MNLSTRYLGLELPHPLMTGASPLADELGSVRELEDAGVAAIVLRSLFEEQIEIEQETVAQAFDQPADSFAEALSYLPEPEAFALGPEEYLEHLTRVKQAVAVPVVASLNGTSEGRWLDYAADMEAAGADALELNVYRMVTGSGETAAQVEDETVAMVAALRERVGLPLAVKLSPFYTALPGFARRLAGAGAAGLVIFNRFYQPDIDIEELEVERRLELSTSAELLLRLRWLAILSADLEVPLAVTGGVHTVVDVVKAVMCGASVVQLVSSLLRRGPSHLARLRSELASWLEEHEYESLEQMRGSMNLARTGNPEAFERANYMTLLQGWRR